MGSPKLAHPVAWVTCQFCQHLYNLLLVQVLAEGEPVAVLDRSKRVNVSLSMLNTELDILVEGQLRNQDLFEELGVAGCDPEW